MFIYLESTINPGVRFRVLSFNKETQIGTLQGELGVEFTRDISKAALDKFHYRVVKSEKELKLSATPTKPKAAEVSDE